MIREPHERLKDLRIRKGFATAADAARAYGWAVTTYQAHENGARGLKRDAAERYAKAFNATAAYVLGLSTNTGSTEPSSPVNQVVNVPVVARASAGTFRYDEGLEEGAILVPAVPHKSVPADAQYSVIVDGPSVNLRIPDGAFAICATYDRYPGGAQHGQLVHVVRERSGLHEHTIKELRYTREGISLVPCSSDPRYQEEVKLGTGEDGELVRIQGVVIGSYQPL
jgi:SOS-response transcriptional repressor LexA